MINKQRLLATFLEYVQIDSESTHEGAMGGPPGLRPGGRRL